ncbi:MAG: TRL-like family protein [Treponema sp.]|nr:TRL-like family protein [Treponema sp.]
MAFGAGITAFRADGTAFGAGALSAVLFFDFFMFFFRNFYIGRLTKIFLSGMMKYQIPIGGFMKKAVLVLALAVVALAMMGCPSLNQPVSATGNPIGSKTGQASGQIILGAFGDVDAGIVAAAQAGGISKVSTVDFQVKNFLGLVVTYTTTVTGE